NYIVRIKIAKVARGKGRTPRPEHSLFLWFCGGQLKPPTQVFIPLTVHNGTCVPLIVHNKPPLVKAYVSQQLADIVELDMTPIQLASGHIAQQNPMPTAHPQCNVIM
ncbi:MAG: hypothetical protein QF535_19765, partial [Anaerolineales bacterium]|nr:hypothetical protein [Anaerolineales bacterium]